MSSEPKMLQKAPGPATVLCSVQAIAYLYGMYGNQMAITSPMKKVFLTFRTKINKSSIADLDGPA